jgi:hypothetical protein
MADGNHIFYVNEILDSPTLLANHSRLVIGTTNLTLAFKPKKMRNIHATYKYHYTEQYADALQQEIASLLRQCPFVKTNSPTVFDVNAKYYNIVIDEIYAIIKAAHKTWHKFLFDLRSLEKS